MEVQIRCNKQAATTIRILDQEIKIQAKGTISLDVRSWLELKRIKSNWLKNGAISIINTTEEEHAIKEYHFKFTKSLETKGISMVRSQINDKHNFSYYELDIVKKWLANKDDATLIKASKGAEESIKIARNANKISMVSLAIVIISLLVTLFNK